MAAFSLVELVIVIGVIALLAAVGAPRYFAVGDSRRLDAAVNRCRADLLLAARHARATGSAVVVRFGAARDGYVLHGVPSSPSNPADYTIDLTAEPYRVKIINADFAGDPVVAINGSGLLKSGGRVVLGVGGRTRTLTVSAPVMEVTIE